MKLEKEEDEEEPLESTIGTLTRLRMECKNEFVKNTCVFWKYQISDTKKEREVRTTFY